MNDDDKVIRDHLLIHQNMIETLKKNSVMAIQDDYAAWKKAGFLSKGGKLLMID